MRPMPMFALANGLSSGVTSVDCTQGELNCSRVTPASPVTPSLFDCCSTFSEFSDRRLLSQPGDGISFSFQGLCSESHSVICITCSAGMQSHSNEHSRQS